jgi:hypothetical protein
MSFSLDHLTILYGLAGAREKFEHLVTLLVKAEHPDARGIRVSTGDGGVDISIGKWLDGNRITVFQVKYFTSSLGDAQKTQIIESYKTARKNTRFTLGKWVLVLSVNLSGDAQKWWDHWCSKQDQDVLIELWDQLHIEHLLVQDKNTPLREEFFQQENQVILREIHAKLKASDQRGIDELNELLQRGNSPTKQSPFVVPYPHNLLFVGRQDELPKLHESLIPADATVVLTGPGGMGKTQLAVELAYRLRDHFLGGIFWLTMDPPDGIEDQVADLAGPKGLNLPNLKDLDFDGKIAAVQAAWQEETPRLLIFDNLNPYSTELFKKWRPHIGGCRVLITSQMGAWPATLGVTVMPLNPLQRPASLDLLLTPRARDQRTSVADLATAKAAGEICEELGDLPLALALAAAYLEAYPQMPLDRYLARLKKQLLDDRSLTTGPEGGLPTNHNPHVAATFALSYNRLKVDKPTDALALTMLHRAAQCAPEPIPRRLLLRASGLDPDSEEAVERGADGPRRLVSLGLIEQLPDGALRLHRLLAAYARSRASDPAGDQAAFEGALNTEVDAILGLPEVDAILGLPYYLKPLRHAVRDRSRTDERFDALFTNLNDLLQAGRNSNGEGKLVARLLRLGLSYSFSDHSSDNEWPDGKLPSSGPCYLVVDGLASQSVSGPFNHIPWLELLRREFRNPDFSKYARGFSYYRSGYHYGRLHTDIGARNAVRLMEDYIALHDDVSVTYLGFSFGCLVLTSGLAAWLRKGIGQNTTKRLILVQPAYKVTKDILYSYRERYWDAWAMPQAVEQFVDFGDSLDEHIMDALEFIVKQNIPVQVLFWRDDTFVEYSSELVTRLKSAGVTCLPLYIESTPGRGPFAEHSAVARNPETLRKLEELIG